MDNSDHCEADDSEFVTSQQMPLIPSSFSKLLVQPKCLTLLLFCSCSLAKLPATCQNTLPLCCFVLVLYLFDVLSFVLFSIRHIRVLCIVAVTVNILNADWLVLLHLLWPLPGNYKWYLDNRGITKPVLAVILCRCLWKYGFPGYRYKLGKKVSVKLHFT